MALEENLPRWIYASASTAFSKSVNGARPIYYEGQDRKDNEDCLEFRLDGPYINRTSQTDCMIDVEINILIVTQIDPKDSQKIYRDCGVALKFFAKPIQLYKYGNTAADDQSYLGCMELRRTSDQRDYVRVSHFGKSDPSKMILQASVEGHYHFLLTGVR